jgi:hypothetical protein
MAACPASRERPLIGDRDFRRDFPPVESNHNYLMIDPGHSRRLGKIIAVELLILAVRAQLSR